MAQCKRIRVRDTRTDRVREAVKLTRLAAIQWAGLGEDVIDVSEMLSLLVEVLHWSGRSESLSLTSSLGKGEPLSEQLARRYPGSDPLEREVVVDELMLLMTMASHFWGEGQVVDPRAADVVLELMFTLFQHGMLPYHPPPQIST
jgi:hypothetical protein